MTSFASVRNMTDNSVSGGNRDRSGEIHRQLQQCFSTLQQTAGTLGARLSNSASSSLSSTLHNPASAQTPTNASTPSDIPGLLTTSTTGDMAISVATTTPSHPATTCPQTLPSPLQIVRGKF